MRHLIVYYKVYYHKWRSAHPQFGEAQRSASTEAKQCRAVDRVSNKTYFSHLKKKVHLQKPTSHEVYVILRIFSTLYFVARQPFLMTNHFYISQI